MSSPSPLRRSAPIVLAAGIVLGACSASTGPAVEVARVGTETTSPVTSGELAAELPTDTDVATTIVATTVDTTTTSTASAAPESSEPATTVATSAPESESTVPVTTTESPVVESTAPTTTVPPEPTTTLAPIPDDVHDSSCVVRAAASGSWELFAATRPDVDVEPGELTGLWVENGFADVVEADQLVDVCVGNGIDDVDGTPVPAMDGADVAAALTANVVRQQEKLNELFAPFAPTELSVDGVSGPRTGQRLCGARLALGIEATIADMAPGSQEQALLFAAAELPTPSSPATESERWVLIDRACQLMFVGNGPALSFVFTTSTGSAGFETRLQDRAQAFRFNPAVDNGGWHDSSEFPVGVDNPLNGNMYKPLYFDLGQAIHGANNVPPVPDSKGCARLRVTDMDTLVEWLGLSDAAEETWRRNEMNVSVTVQGEFTER